MRNKKGFSLVELLAVVVIIGVLTSMALPNYRVYTIKTKVASNMPFLSALQNDMLNHYDRTGTLPTRLTQLSINKAEFNFTSDNPAHQTSATHIPTGCEVSINNTPAVKMDCHQGWNMEYILESTPYGYRLGAKTFNIEGDTNDKKLLERVAKGFGWKLASASRSKYTII